MVKKLLTFGALAAVLSLQSYAETSCPEVKPEVSKVFTYAGHSYIRYMDVPTSATLGVERVMINGVLDREVMAGAHGDLERGFPLANVYPTLEGVCNEVVIKVFDETPALVTESNVFRFGDLTACTIAKPEIQKIYNYSNTWYIRYTDLRTTATLDREHIIIDGVMDRNVVAGSHDPISERGFALTGDYNATTCHTAKIEAFNEDNSSAAVSDTFYFGDTSTCVCAETPPA